MKTLLSIESVSRRFGDYLALDHVNLQVEQGEFIALLGPSGCGKTTLLRTIAGFLTPDEGRIVIGGEDFSKAPPYQRPLNTVFQNYALFPHMSVAQNVAYGPLRQGASRRDAEQRALEALDMVGLSHLSDRYPRQMSGGQQQRVALARAIVNRPKLLLLDEPLSALDMKLRKRMQLELKHLQEKLGIAFIFVTHDQEEAMSMADRIVVMNAGRIEQMGTGTDIYLQPSTRFVAEFIGDANLIDCTVSGHTVRLQTGQSLQVQAAPQGKVLAMLRPEHMVCVEANAPSDAPSAQHLVLQGVLKDIVTVGSHTTLYVDVGGLEVAVRHIGMPRPGLAQGALMTLRAEQRHVHFVADGT
jgi:spermidine/putrescine transport system ATP-binding protein